MDNRLFVIKEGDTIRLRLECQGRPSTELTFPLDIHFDTMLVTSIDKILKENRIDKVSPPEVISEGFGDGSSMASMIVQTVTAAMKTGQNSS